MTECPPSSASVLHKQWAKLENEHHEFALAIDAARAKKADVALMRKRQENLLREIGSLVAKIRNAEENDGPPDEAKEIARSKPRRGE